jgi:hypothetical protein
MAISLDSSAKHPSMFVGQEFMNAIKSSVPVCPKCANRLAIGRNEELVCVIHGPINKIDHNVRPNPNVSLRMKSLTPAPSCIKVIPETNKKCGASVMFVDDRWVCESCERRERIEKNKSDLLQKTKDDTELKDESSNKDGSPSLGVREDLHDGVPSSREKKLKHVSV